MDFTIPLSQILLKIKPFDDYFTNTIQISSINQINLINVKKSLIINHLSYKEFSMERGLNNRVQGAILILNQSLP